MNKMEQKNCLNKLLSDIQELEYLVRELLEQDILSIQTLSNAGNKSSLILDNIKAIENEEIRLMNDRLTEQQAELNHLSILLAQYQQMADTCRKNIITKKEEIKEAETLLVEKPLETENKSDIVFKASNENSSATHITKMDKKQAVTPKETFRSFIPENKDNVESNIEQHIVNQEVQETIIKEDVNFSNPVMNPEQTNLTEKHQEHNLSGISKNNISLNDILEKKNLSDFKKAFSLNDRFRFRRDLFHGNENQMNQVINDLNQIGSLDQAIEYINKNLSWDMNSEPVTDFMKLLEKRYI